MSSSSKRHETDGSQPKLSFTRNLGRRLVNTLLRRAGNSVRDDTDDTEPSSSAFEDYMERDRTGWSESAREEINDFDMAADDDVERDSKILRSFTISLSADHIDPQGEWIETRRSQAEQIALCTRTHLNVIRSREPFYPRLAVFLESKAQERFLARTENDRNGGPDNSVTEELRRHYLLDSHACAWKGDEFIVRKRWPDRDGLPWERYTRSSPAISWKDGILVKFTTLSEQGVEPQDTEFVPVADFLRSKRDSTATTTAQETTSSG
ncbi:hypothetical protein JCM24511_00086 [Saitozyma sp. JCM 24511]|nr:hypothetical protein JCM24511_00086 [Saitozyma sp. JCM 24511]